MEKKFIFLFFLILFVNIISCINADINPSVGRLDFNLEIGQEECHGIIISSEDYSSTIRLRDVWTEDLSNKNTNTYDLDAGNFDLTIDYADELNNFDGEEEVQVCIMGNKLLEKTRGSLIFTPYSTTNVVIEKGVWLFVTVSEETSEKLQNKTQQNQTATSPSSKSSTSSSSANAEEEISSQENSANVNLELTSDPNSEIAMVEVGEFGEGSSGITGSVIGENNSKKNWKILGLSLIAVFAVAVISGYNQNKKRRKNL